MPQKQKNTESKWYMAGTEGTGEYVVIASSPNGRVGYRLLKNSGSVRIRIEPDGAFARVWESNPGSLAVLSKDAGWKQPSEWNNRFSLVTYDTVKAIEAIELALRLLESPDCKRQFKARLWRRELRRHLATKSTVPTVSTNTL